MIRETIAYKDGSTVVWACREGFMKKLVLMMIAMLALITFIRDYRAPAVTGTHKAQLESTSPN
ncbi:MAG: hypothetical protein A3J97_03045 [Spirochaetes bacterium RIFOXYC1_FULL_54_7]|nr:MAG: hypothetical protein A3J97_03045 [Spirochaetes bacterium RIFOXYC1_FULL_54_7]